MTTRHSLLWKALIALGCAMLCHLPLRADDVAQAGRTIVAKYQESLVTLSITLKIHTSMNGEQNTDDEKSEAIGTVINPSGLIVASLATADPAEALAGMGRDHEEMKITTEIVNLIIRTADGKEMPGKIVLRDKDLDLVFIRPLKKPAAPLAALDMKAGIVPGLLDEMAIIYRLGNIASHAVCITVDRLQAVVQKPRTFYVPGIAAMSTRLGAPVFALDGHPIGILLLRTAPESKSGMSSSSGGIGEANMLYIVLPAADILDAAKDAPEVSAVKDAPPVKDTPPVKK